MEYTVGGQLTNGQSGYNVVAPLGLFPPALVGSDLIDLLEPFKIYPIVSGVDQTSLQGNPGIVSWEFVDNGRYHAVIASTQPHGSHFEFSYYAKETSISFVVIKGVILPELMHSAGRFIGAVIANYQPKIWNMNWMQEKLKTNFDLFSTALTKRNIKIESLPLGKTIEEPDVLDATLETYSGEKATDNGFGPINIWIEKKEGLLTVHPQFIKLPSTH